MKRFIALLLALCLPLLPALADTAAESIVLTVGESALTLKFDSSEEYSSVSDGKATASFYTYTENGNRLYDLTLTFPESVQAGDVVDSAYALAGHPECAVAAIFSDQQSAIYYFAGIINGASYASFSIAFDAVTDTADGRRYEGRLTARLMGMDMYGRQSDVDPLDIADAPFSFTMPAANRSDSDDAAPDDDYNPFESDPSGDEDPFTTPTPTPAHDLVKV